MTTLAVDIDTFTGNELEILRLLADLRLQQETLLSKMHSTLKLGPFDDQLDDSDDDESYADTDSNGILY